MTPPLAERIARLIRTERLKKSRGSRLEIMLSRDAPAEDADLVTANLILAEIAKEG